MLSETVVRELLDEIRSDIGQLEGIIELGRLLFGDEALETLAPMILDLAGLRQLEMFAEIVLGERPRPVRPDQVVEGELVA